MRLPVEKVHPNPDQPRRHFDADALADLARSIAEKGIIQPLIVRESPREPGAYEIVAGERRWRAAQMAKLHEVPVLLRSFTDIEVLEVAIIENIQRADLNPVEEAAGYSQLMTKFGHTQEKLAEVLGKSRSHIANAVRLLNLPEDVQEHLRQGRLSAGHARALITAPDASALSAKIIQKGLSVRETEKLAKADPTAKKSAKRSEKAEKDADTRALESDLSAALSMTVRIDHKPGQEGGALSIHYASLDDLDRLMALLSA
jgi:ParB family chromosome partitioning protein